ncbi:MAG: FG-GAP repeat domain-containing protein, partial [Planctomycetota bacterium]
MTRGIALTLGAVVLLGCSGDTGDAAPENRTAGVADPSSVPETAPGPRFEEVAESVGVKFHMTFLEPEQGANFKINLYDHGSGIAIDDYDGDGDDDLYLLNQLGKNRLFRNRGDGTFDDVTDEARVGLANVISVAAAFADCDNDGDSDLYVTTTRGGNVYFENTGDGKFRDRTREAGLKLIVESMSPTFFDVDSDGDLDLLVTNTANWTLDSFDEGLRYYRGPSSLWDLVGAEKAYNVLYLNDGTGKFTDVSEEAGIRGRGWGGDTAVFDYDEDGDLDVYVCNMFGANLLFQNDGKGRFKDVAQEVMGRTSWGAVGAKALDFDGDAHLDLYVVDMHSDMWGALDLPPDKVEEAKKYPSFMARSIEIGAATSADDERFARSVSLESDKILFGNTLFRRTGTGSFEEVSDSVGAETWWPWGIAAADFDADGDVDVFLPSGMGHPYRYARSPLLLNGGDGTFQDVVRDTGIEPPPGGRYLNLEYDGK